MQAPFDMDVWKDEDKDRFSAAQSTALDDDEDNNDDNSLNAWPERRVLHDWIAAPAMLVQQLTAQL